jgi:hypothetical protein
MPLFNRSFWRASARFRAERQEQFAPVFASTKYEEVYRSEYRDLAEARPSIGVFLEQVYNQKRLHSALGYLSRGPQAPPSRAGLDERKRPVYKRKVQPSSSACLRFTSRLACCRESLSQYNATPVNGEQWLNCLSQPRDNPNPLIHDMPDVSSRSRHSYS